MSTYLASIGVQNALLFTDFGEMMARRYFPAEMVDALPRYKRGKHVGKLKGMVVWHKVQRGGWVREQSMGCGERSIGHVERRVGQIIKVELTEAEWGVQEQKVLHTWELPRTPVGNRPAEAMVV